ncbi:MAG: DUF4058 family protein [Xenococcaceae cyanobacterium]
MSSPFPGMDPYLENPDLWPEVHSRLIVAIADAIAPSVRPKYRVAIEKRTYLTNASDSVAVEIPDVAVLSKRSTINQTASTVTVTMPTQDEAVTVRVPIPEIAKEGYLEIKEVATGSVVTVIEVLSPSNKRAGKGREAYEEKRQEVFASPTNLVEIDLLRGGVVMPVLGEVPQTDYRILVYRRRRRPFAQLYAFNVRDEIPKFLLPLRSEDVEPEVDLQNLIVGVYDRAGFDSAVDYRTEPVPGFKPKDRNWADALLQEKGWR